MTGDCGQVTEDRTGRTQYTVGQTSTRLSYTSSATVTNPRMTVENVTCEHTQVSEDMRVMAGQ